jgi:predicted nuclease of predicted toxin-antitoxin system
MKFVADENIDRQVIDRLRQDGHIVMSVSEMDPGISDDVVLDLSNQEGSLLLTADKDFGELVFRQHRLMTGVVLIRLAGLSPLLKAEVVASAIKRHITELSQAFALISPGVIRIRKRSE